MRIKDKGMALVLYIMEFFRRAAQLSWTSSLKLSRIYFSHIVTQHPTIAALVLKYVFDSHLLMRQRQMRNIVKNAEI